MPFGRLPPTKSLNPLWRTLKIFILRSERYYRTFVKSAAAGHLGGQFELGRGRPAQAAALPFGPAPGNYGDSLHLAADGPLKPLPQGFPCNASP